MSSLVSSPSPAPLAAAVAPCSWLAGAAFSVSGSVSWLPGGCLAVSCSGAGRFAAASLLRQLARWLGLLVAVVLYGSSAPYLVVFLGPLPPAPVLWRCALSVRS